ncbi:MAG TPA: hypothetical protein VNM37_29400, partial [Candidatus Dormibacteraeota bacterium]|nr:hypothetical protein [Candidatus Dormibacteraeota bacterium]
MAADVRRLKQTAREHSRNQNESRDLDYYDGRKKKGMNIVVLDGHTLNPGDLSWEGLKELGSCVVHPRTAA